MIEADARHLEAILADVEPLLGPGVVVDSFEREDEDAGCRLILRYHLGGASTTSEGGGTTIVAAHAALREAVVVDRVALAIRAFIAG